MSLNTSLSIILLVIYCQGIALSFFMLFLKRKKKLPIYFIALFTFIFSSAVIGKLLMFIGVYSQDSIYHFLHTSLLLGMGPAIYHYFVLQLSAKPRFRRKSILHFVPMFIEMLFYIIVPSSSILADYAFIYTSEQIIAQISIIVYTTASLRLINKQIKQNGDTQKTSWYKRLILMYMFGIIMWIAYVNVNYLIYNDGLEISEYFPLYIYAAFVVYAIAYSALLKPLLATSSSKKFKTIPEAYHEIASKITEYMHSEKPYLNPELRVKEFASKLNIPQNTVSEVINMVFMKSFSDYICEHRINMIKEKLLLPESKMLTIESIALENGFKSRSVFNTSFKKLTGLSPKEFMDLQDC